MLAGGEGLRLGPASFSISRYGFYLVLSSGLRPIGLVIKPKRLLRLAEDRGSYRHSGRIGPLYWRTFDRD